MIIIIDGYNLLKYLFPKEKHHLNKQKQTLIRQLAHYKKNKRHPINQIILVFDAGPSTHATRMIKSEVVIIYSGTNSNADDWILQFVEKNQGKEIIVVTRDRMLREACKSHGADWLDIDSFYSLVQQTNAQTLIPQEYYNQNMIIKYKTLDSDEGIDKEADSTLDHLMEQAMSQSIDQKSADLDMQASPRSKKSYTLSKIEKHIRRKLKKLE